MKTVMKAALLLSVSFFFTQASLAGGNGNGPDKEVPPPKSFCTYDAAATDCAAQLSLAHGTLVAYQDAFKSDRDFAALTCKVAASDVKIAEDKAADAELKLSDSVVKIETLASQGKINDYDAAMEMAEAMESARACANGLISATP